MNKVFKKILALAFGAMLLTGCSLMEKLQSSSSSSTSSSTSSGTTIAGETFCANAVNTTVNYTSGQNTVLNLSSTAASKIYETAHQSTVVVNACYSVSGKEYNYITSGFVYSSSNNNKYYILTNSSGIFHRYYNKSGTITSENLNVIKYGDFEITFDDGRRYTASLVGTYDTADVALFSVTTTDTIKVATIGSSDAIEVGDSVLAIGTPSLGDSLINTLVRGSISGVNRRQTVYYDEVINGIDRTFKVADYDAFQFDAPVNGGMEGGPVYNSSGEVIGMLSYKYSSATSSSTYESISMAIPVDNIKNVIQQLIATGSYTRPTIGVTVSDVDTFTESQRSANNIADGVYSGNFIAAITENSSASKAGMVTGEVLVAFDGVAVPNLSSVSGLLIRHNIGDVITLTTKDSAGATHNYTLTL